MASNMGTMDRVIRLVLGLGIVGAGVLLHSWWGAIGLILILTSSINFCPLYVLIGVSTNRGN